MTNQQRVNYSLLLVVVPPEKQVKLESSAPVSAAIEDAEKTQEAAEKKTETGLPSTFRDMLADEIEKQISDIGTDANAASTLPAATAALLSRVKTEMTESKVEKKAAPQPPAEAPSTPALAVPPALNGSILHLKSFNFGFL